MHKAILVPTLREFKMEKTQAIFAILTAVYGQSPWSVEQIEADMTKSDTAYFYVYQDGEVVGFLSVQDLAGEREITNIAIHPDYQGQGLADQLMQELVSYDQPIFLEVRSSNQAAQNLYTKHRFEVVGRRKNYYHHPVEDAVLMKRG